MAAALERALGSAAEEEEEEEKEDAEAAPPVPVLVLGPAGSGRTALLLRVALAGGPRGPRALYLAPSAPPRLPAGGGDPRALQRLELRYPPSAAALARELAALPSQPRPPGLVLLDGLERYLSGGSSPGSPPRLAALALEVSSRCPAQVLVALRLPPPNPRVLHALRRFFPAECRLRPPGSPPGMGTLLIVTRPGTPARRWTLRFGTQGQLRVQRDGDNDGDSDSKSDGDTDGDRDTESDGDIKPQVPQTPGWGHRQQWGHQERWGH